MGRRKYPDAYNTVINFDTGKSDILPETTGERASRLRKASQARRRVVLAEFRKVGPGERMNALAKAFRLLEHGKPLPIHFDVLFIKANVTRTERYTLKEAPLIQRADRSNKLVASQHAIKAGSNRSKSIPPDFIHRVIWTQNS